MSSNKVQVFKPPNNSTGMVLCPTTTSLLLLLLYVGGLLLILLLGVDCLLFSEDGQPGGHFRQHEEETPGVRD